MTIMRRPVLHRRPTYRERPTGIWKKVDQLILDAFIAAGGTRQMVDAQDPDTTLRPFLVAVEAYRMAHERVTGNPPDSTPEEMRLEVLDTLRYEVPWPFLNNQGQIEEIAEAPEESPISEETPSVLYEDTLMLV